MAAPKGNQFWKLRSKHGRDTLFESEDLLWEAACEYFTWCDKHPWKKVEQAKGTAKPKQNKDGKWSFPPNLVELPTKRPYTLSGLMLYCCASESYFRTFKATNKENKHEGFLTVIARIEEVIATDQFEGATVGAYNANIISRKLGLAEKVDNSGKVITYNVEVTKEEARKISDALEDEV